MNLSRWPSGQVVLEKAMAPESLEDVGAVLTVMQGLYQTFEEDFKDMKISIQSLREEMDSQAHHFAVNLEIVLKQAQVRLYIKVQDYTYIYIYIWMHVYMSIICHEREL